MKSRQKYIDRFREKFRCHDEVCKKLGLGNHFKDEELHEENIEQFLDQALKEYGKESIARYEKKVRKALVKEVEASFETDNFGMIDGKIINGILAEQREEII